MRSGSPGCTSTLRQTTELTAWPWDAVDLESAPFTGGEHPHDRHHLPEGTRWAVYRIGVAKP